MNFKEYQEQAQRTSNNNQVIDMRLMIAALGLNGEAGEVADMIKKHIGHGHNLDLVALSKELGDVLWYIAEISSIIGYPLETVAKNNILKLQRRYPKGFSSERSINREE